MGGDHIARNAHGLYLLRTPYLMASKEIKTIILQSKGVEFYHNPVSLEEDLKLQTRTQSGRHPNFSIVRIFTENPVTPCWTSQLQACEINN